MRDDDRLNALLYEQLKDQLNLLATSPHLPPDGGLRHTIHNDELYRTWLQLKRRKALN